MNKLMGLALLMVGMVLAVGAGANFRYYEADRDITVAIVADDSEFIDLTPLQPYAYLSNGKLTIKIDDTNPNYNQSRGWGIGLSPNTTYVFEEMFEVSNDLWENNETDYPICVSILAPPQAELFVGEWNGTTASTLQFTVYHGDPVKIGMVFDSTGMDMGMHNFQMSIHAEAGECPQD
ncbi:DUF1102 domain-containing protein [Palaeococcus ferrophilus]|uniref:DUF1102 domain-containing protein n=1 Tax=Palaeococcus ferrophilus TaxID=83868 RepID=UPI00064ECD8B|nr:DUF1102 domain-containing protein [Palaeococcus ferrophilus]